MRSGGISRRNTFSTWNSWLLRSKLINYRREISNWEQSKFTHISLISRFLSHWNPRDIHSTMEVILIKPIKIDNISRHSCSLSHTLTRSKCPLLPLLQHLLPVVATCFELNFCSRYGKMRIILWTTSTVHAIWMWPSLNWMSGFQIVKQTVNVLIFWSMFSRNKKPHLVKRLCWETSQTLTPHGSVHTRRNSESSILRYSHFTTFSIMLRHLSQRQVIFLSMKLHKLSQVWL